MLSIGLVASASAAATYFLGDAPGCQAGYYLRPDGHVGRWIGGGAIALGLSGGIDARGEHAFRLLLDGRAPRGDRLVEPVMRSDPRSLLPASPLVKAVRSAAAAMGVPVPYLLDDRRLADRFVALARRAAGRGVRVDVAERIAGRTGRDLHAIYGRPGRNSSRLVERARRYLGKQVDKRRAGYDLTFSAPKSVSLLAAFGDPAVAAHVHASHRAAVADALGWLERATATAARGHHGDGQRAARVATSGFVAAAFDHGTSRAGDPQVHTHVVVANLLQGADGRWSAVDSRALYRQSKTAGYLYQAALRAQLTTRLGVGWEPVRRGSAEVAGIPSTVIRVFSKRSEQVRAALRAKAATGAKAAQAACLDTRPDKEQVPTDLLRERWVAELRSQGLQPARLVAACVGRQVTPGFPDHVVAGLLGPNGLTRHETAFDRGGLLQALAAAAPGGADVVTIEQAADALLVHPDVVTIGENGEAPARWTTAGLLATEQRALTTADVLRRRQYGASSTQSVESAITSHILSAEQAEMVRAVTSGNGALHVVVGPAGSGKTAALAAAHRVWSGEGRLVVGVALSAMAARQLTHGSGIRSLTLTQALRQLEQTPRSFLPAAGVLVLDEAGMVGTRDLDRLLAHVAASDASAVLVGDPAQLPEIEAGGLFGELAAVGPIRLTENRRQSAAWERAALAELRDGAPGRALDAYVQHDRVHVAVDTDDQQARAVADYLSWHGRGADVAILAATRAQVRALNTRVREELTANGALEGPELVISAESGNVALRTGDRVAVTANRYDRGLLNGTQARVVAVDTERRAATVVTDDGEPHVFDHEQLASGLLDHSYAITCHKAQGQTLDVALVVGSAALARETAYVALSRGREENHLYLAPEAARADPGTEWLLDAVMSTTDRQFQRSARHLMAGRQVESSLSRRAPALAAEASRGLTR
ncbi:MAG: MobF family relaxase [Candidatus Nanopelagicales bacterium]|jgi:conjugative relaxase-like TrwC/TraI family protein